MKKRILPFLLALLMLLEMLPVSTLAEDTVLEPPACDSNCNTESVSGHQQNCAVKEYYRQIYRTYSAEELYAMRDVIGQDAWEFIVSESWNMDNAKAMELKNLIENGESTDPSDPEDSCTCCENCTGAEGCQCQCGVCDFCQPEEPEFPVLTHPTGVEVTAESFPEGVSLSVKDANVSAQLGEFKIPESKKVFGLDISLVNADRSEYQPGGALVKVPVEAALGTKIGIIHDHNGVITFMGVTEVRSDGTVEFYTDSFSEFAGFTVDFHYNGVDFSIEGMSEILLSDLFTAMGIEEDAYAAQSVVFSDNTLVGVEKQSNGDWLLTSLDAFDTEETLVINFTDGRTIVIDVTDPAWEPVYFSFPNSSTTGITGHTKDNIVGSKTVTVILYDAITGKELDRATNTKVNGNFFLELRSDKSKYWFEITEISGGHVALRTKGLLDNYNSYTYTSKLDQYSVTFERTKTGTGTVTIKVNCYPTQITNSTNSDYCYVSRVTKLAAPNDTQTRSLNIVVDRAGNNDTTVTYSNLLFPDRNGDGNGHGDVEADRDITITGTAPGYKNATKKESGATYIVTVNPITYTIVFNGNGNTGGGMSNQSFEYDVAQGLRANAYTRAYTVKFDSKGEEKVEDRIATATFNGWATTNTGSVKYKDQESVQKLTTEDGKQITLFANWTKGKVTLPTLPDRDGYTFGGWTYAGKTYAAGEEFTPEANLTMTAVWTPVSYTVTYDVNGATSGAIADQTHKFDEEFTLPTPKKEYTVSFDNDGNGTVDSTTTVAYTFNGWEDRGTIVYNGVSYTASMFDSPYYANTYWDLYNAFQYNKYALIGHYVNNGKGEGRSCIDPEIVNGENVRSYYQASRLTVKNLASTAVSVPLKANWSSNSITLPTLSETGKRFLGWSDGTTTYTAGASYTPEANVTMTALWEADTYTVTWKNWDGTVLETDTVIYNGSATFDKTQPTRPDAGGYSYTFNGWDKGSNGTVSNVTANTTVTARYSQNPIDYTATFNYNGGDSGVASRPFTVESALSLPKLTRTGYAGVWKVTTAAGNWENGKEYASEGSVTAGKYGNVTFTAQWTAQYRYVLKFDANGGSGGPADQTRNWCGDTSYTFSWDQNSVPTREGYSFLGWAEASTSQTNVAGSGYNSYQLTGKQTETVEKTLYAIWKRDTGNLKLTFNGGETSPAIVTVTGQNKTITLVLTEKDTVIKDLPTGTYEVTVESGNASYTASVKTNSNPQIEKNKTAEVEIEISSLGLNWFTAFFRVKNKRS